MGRSKFPGKPSKSINRKRISVVQLDDEAKTAAPIQATTNISTTTTTTTHESTEQPQNDSEEQECTIRVLDNKNVTVSKNTFFSSRSDAQPVVIAKPEKRKNGTGGTRHCSDNNGASEHHGQRDDDDDSDNNLNHRQRAMGTTTTINTSNLASSSYKSNMDGCNNGNVNSVNGKTHDIVGNAQKLQYKTHKYLATKTISIVDKLAEESQYSSDDNNNQSELDEKALHKVSFNHKDDKLHIDGNDTIMNMLIPTKQHSCDKNGSITIGLFGNKKPSSASSSPYATVCSPSSSQSSNCSSSSNSSTSGCGVSRNYHEDNDRYHDGKGKRQTHRKKFATLNLAKVEVMLPSTSKWKEAYSRKNPEENRYEQQVKVLNCHDSAITSLTTTEHGCSFTDPIATFASSDCITPITSFASVTVSLFETLTYLRPSKSMQNRLLGNSINFP